MRSLPGGQRMSLAASHDEPARYVYVAEVEGACYGDGGVPAGEE